MKPNIKPLFNYKMSSSPKRLADKAYWERYWAAHRCCPHCRMSIVDIEGGDRICPLCGGKVRRVENGII